MPLGHHSGFVTVKGGNLWYEVVGSGPQVVLLPSGNFLSDARAWEAQVSYLSRSMTVVRYDDRGYGKSSPPTSPYSRSEDALAVIGALDVQETALVGEYIGSEVALKTALVLGSQVSDLVLISPSLSRLPLPAEFRDVHKEELIERGAELGRQVVPHLEEGQRSGDFSLHVEDVISQMDDLGATDRARVREMFLHNAPNLLPERVLLALRDTGAKPDWVTELTHILTRTLVVVSRANDIGNGYTAKFLLDRLPNASKVLLPQGNVSIVLEDPGGLNEALGLFLTAKSKP